MIYNVCISLAEEYTEYSWLKQYKNANIKDGDELQSMDLLLYLTGHITASHIDYPGFIKSVHNFIPTIWVATVYVSEGATKYFCPLLSKNKKCNAKHEQQHIVCKTGCLTGLLDVGAYGGPYHSVHGPIDVLDDGACPLDGECIQLVFRPMINETYSNINIKISSLK